MLMELTHVIAQAATGQGKMDEAEKYWRTLLSVAKELRSYKGEIEALLGMGIIARTRNIKEAVPYFEKADSLARNAKDKAMEFKVVHSWGKTYAESNDKEEGLKCISRAIDIAKSSNNYVSQIQALISQGKVHWAQSEHDKAQASFQEGQDLAQKHSLSGLEASCSLYVCLSSPELDSKSVPFSEDITQNFEKTIELAKKGDNPRVLKSALLTYAELLLNKREFQKCVTISEQARSECEKAADVFGQIKANTFLTRAHRELGNEAAAKAALTYGMTLVSLIKKTLPKGTQEAEEL